MEPLMITSRTRQRQKSGIFFLFSWGQFIGKQVEVLFPCDALDVSIKLTWPWHGNHTHIDPHLNPWAVNWRYPWSSWLFPFITDGGWLDEVVWIKRGLPEQTYRGHYSSTGAAMPDRFLVSIVIYWRLTSHLSGSHCPQSFSIFLKQVSPSPSSLEVHQTVYENTASHCLWVNKPERLRPCLPKAI